jgi:hypothetical protein
MKSIFKLLTVVLISVLLASCGGSAGGADVLVGKWKIDLSTADLILGDGVPAPMKGMIEGQKEGFLAEGASKSDDITIEFTEAGKMIASKKGEEKNEEFDYTFDGSKLAITGESEGEKIDVSLNISEASADKFTIAMTGEEILSQIKAKYPKMLEGAGGMDVDAMVKGCSVAVSFKK